MDDARPSVGVLDIRRDRLPTAGPLPDGCGQAVNAGSARARGEAELGEGEEGDGIAAGDIATILGDVDQAVG